MKDYKKMWYKAGERKTKRNYKKYCRITRRFKRKIEHEIRWMIKNQWDERTIYAPEIPESFQISLTETLKKKYDGLELAINWFYNHGDLGITIYFFLSKN